MRSTVMSQLICYLPPATRYLLYALDSHESAYLLPATCYLLFALCSMRSTGMHESAYWISYWTPALLNSVLVSLMVYLLGE